VARFEFGFAANYISVNSYNKGGDPFTWNMRRPLKSGAAYTGQANIDPASSGDATINLDNIDYIFPSYDTEVAGAPDFGEIRGVSWSVSIDRTNIYDLGNPMVLDRKISPTHAGTLTIDYNYEGQEINAASLTDTAYTVDITSTNGEGTVRQFRIYDAILENISLNANAEGNPDSYTAQFSFIAHQNSGIKEGWN